MTDELKAVDACSDKVSLVAYLESGQDCDGIHDESAPGHYLCSRCFPFGEIPPPQDDEDDADLRRDEPDEME